MTEKEVDKEVQKFRIVGYDIEGFKVVDVEIGGVTFKNKIAEVLREKSEYDKQQTKLNL